MCVVCGMWYVLCVLVASGVCMCVRHHMDMIKITLLGGWNLGSTSEGSGTY